jgi:type II secretory pathway pseudopilin PulG
MIELLVVIAIIAILAAIIFPAAASAKDAAYRSSDISHLNELRSALQLYRVDQGAYPPELFGYVETYATGSDAGQTIPPDQIQSFLFPKRVTSFSTFQPAYDHSALAATVGGMSPNLCKVANPPAGCVYWPGPATHNPSCASQAYGYDPSSPSTSLIPVLDPTGTVVLPLYATDGYDAAPVKEAVDGSTRYEIHYALFWTGYGLGVTPPGGSTQCSLGSASDDPKQLGYNNPPDSTVITWDTFFRNYGQDNYPVAGKRDVVLFLGGNAKMYDSKAVDQNAWNISP